MGDIAKLEGIGVDDAVNRVLDLPPNAEDEDEGAGDLRFAEFDIESVLNKAAPLLAAKTSDMEALGMGNDSGDGGTVAAGEAEFEAEAGDGP